MLGSLHYKILTKLYVLVSSAHKITHSDMTYIVFESDVNAGVPLEPIGQ